MIRLAKLAIAVATLLASTEARAALLITFSQVGTDVVSTATGSLNVTGLIPSATYSATTGVTASSAFALVGPTPSQNPQGVGYNVFFSGATSLGPGSGIFRPDSGTGNLGGLVYNSSIVVSAGYISGSTINASSTYLNRTLAGLGIATGTYNFLYSATRAGGELDRIVVQVGAVPEPASLAMVGIGLLGAGVLARGRRH